MSTGAQSAYADSTASPPLHEHVITHASLIEYLANQAVTELVVAEFDRGIYRLEAWLSWRAGKSVLVAARGAERTFRSLDTLAKFLLTIGIGATVVRLELKP
jgi:hypothetical protein